MASLVSGAARASARVLPPALLLNGGPQTTPTAVSLSDYDRHGSALVVSRHQRGSSRQAWRSEQQQHPHIGIVGSVPRTRTRTMTAVRERRSGQVATVTAQQPWAPHRLAIQPTFFDSRLRPLAGDDAGLLMFAEHGPNEDKDRQPSRDVNRANLGKTLRVLQERLPTLLQSPLPQDILAPTISLHLFPTTHPHLPTVSGRVAYTAALWTSPIAWNRVPLLGNVRVDVLSERVTREPLPFAGPRRAGAVPEQLVVRWKTLDGGGKSRDIKKNGPSVGVNGTALDGAAADKGEFTGLFIFQFDQEGRVLSHTIENAQTGSGWENGLGAKVVGLTDWLLGGLKREGQPIQGV